MEETWEKAEKACSAAVPGTNTSGHVRFRG